MRSRPTMPGPTFFSNTVASRPMRCAPWSTAPCSRAAATTSGSFAVFIGGADVAKGEALLREACGAFFGPVRVSVMLDANGCNTTATAAVVKLLSAGGLRGKKAVVLAGTGPVGRRAAALLAAEGADVIVAETLPTETLERAKAACATIEERFGVQVTPAAAADLDATAGVLEGAEAVLCTGAAGLQMIPETLWRGHPTLKVLGDVNAVPPLGLEGTKPTWDGKDVDGQTVYGALGIGALRTESAPALDRPTLRAERPGPGRRGDLRTCEGPGEVVRTLVLGVSTRAMVESAVHGGHDVVAADFFGDRDQASLAESYSLPRDLGLPPTAEGLAAAAERLEADAVVYGSNLENHPRGGQRACPRSTAVGEPRGCRPRGARLGVAAPLLPGGWAVVPHDPAARRGAARRARPLVEKACAQRRRSLDHPLGRQGAR